MNSLSHVWLFLTPWTTPWQAPHPWGFAGKKTGMHCHFQLQIVQANCSILLDGLCTHLHIPTLHSMYSHGQFEAAQKNLSQWWVCGWSLEGCQRLCPRTSPLVTPQLRSAALPGFTSVTEPPPRPQQVFRAQVRHGSQETREDPPAVFRFLWPRHSPGSESFVSESLG